MLLGVSLFLSLWTSRKVRTVHTKALHRAAACAVVANELASQPKRQNTTHIRLTVPNRHKHFYLLLLFFIYIYIYIYKHGQAQGQGRWLLSACSGQV